MKKSLLLQHYIELKQTFRLYFYKTKNGYQMEDIHQLRVGIKKLRAIWSLLKAITKGKPVFQQQQEYISELFDAAGAVREAQVNLQIINKADGRTLKPIIAYYKKIEKKAGKQLKRIMKDFDQVYLEILDVQLQQEIISISNEVIIDKSVAFILKKIKKINSIKKELPNNHKLHKIRIHLKKVNSILSIIEEISTSKELSFIKANIKKINNKIGIWHDYTILIPILDKFERKEKKKKKKRDLKAYLKALSKKQSKRENKIQHMLNLYLTSSQRKKLRKYQLAQVPKAF